MSYCSERCIRRYSGRIARRRYGRSANEREARRRRERARERIVGTTGEFHWLVIGQRDGWICGICRQQVDQGLRVPDLLAPTVDHVVPVSRGGIHRLDNVQLAHFICNAEKGDALPEEIDSLLERGVFSLLR